MMMKFARVFETQQFGQVVIMRDRDPAGYPSVTIYSMLAGTDAIVPSWITFSDDAEGFEERDKVFSELTEEDVTTTVSELHSSIAMIQRDDLPGRIQ